jgi:hypothetical protein
MPLTDYPPQIRLLGKRVAQDKGRWVLESWPFRITIGWTVEEAFSCKIQLVSDFRAIILDPQPSPQQAANACGAYIRRRMGALVQELAHPQVFEGEASTLWERLGREEEPAPAPAEEPPQASEVVVLGDGDKVGMSIQRNEEGQFEGSFVCWETLPGEERDDLEALKREREDSMDAARYFSKHGVAFENPRGAVGSTSLDVCPGLIGKPWNNAAVNLLVSLRPSMVRVIRPNQAQTADSYRWRVTVALDDQNLIRAVRQEVDVGLQGFRNGWDVSQWLQGREDFLERPQPTGFINPRAVSRLELHSDENESV